MTAKRGMFAFVTGNVGGSRVLTRALIEQAFAAERSVTDRRPAGMLSTMTNPADDLFNEFARCADVTDKIDTVLFALSRLATPELVDEVHGFLDNRQGVNATAATQVLSHDVAGFKGKETVIEEATGIQPGDQVVDVREEPTDPVTNPGSSDGLA